jgi:hypothetical protein
MPALLLRHAADLRGGPGNPVTWHKFLERVCDATVTRAPSAAGETRQYVYDRILTPGRRKPDGPREHHGTSTMEPEHAVRGFRDACE